MLRSLFICTILSVASYFFTLDSRKLVLDPLERIIEKVKIISENPMTAASDRITTCGIHSFADTIK